MALFRLAAVLLIIGGSASAQAEIRLTVGMFKAPPGKDGVPAAQLGAMMVTPMFQLADAARKNGSCEIALIETSDAFIRDRKRENDLQKKRYARKTGEYAGKIAVSDTMTGTVSVENGTISWTVEVSRGAPKTVVASDSGTAPESELLDISDRIAKSLFEKLCRMKAVRIKGGLNDLQIDQPVCDITVPFSLQGLGQTAGLRLSFTPAGDSGGSVTLSGKAAGLAWSGGGSYSQTIDDKSGTMQLSMTSTVHSPMGKFSDSAPMSLALTRISSTACAGSN